MSATLNTSNMIRNLIDRLFPNANSLGHTITILGLSNSGKTTLLYLLKTGEIIKTTPTIVGFNVEIVNVKTASNKSFKMTGWDLGRSCDSHQYGFIRFYTVSTDAIIWVVDSSDRNSLAESVEVLTRVISGVDHDRTDTIPIVIFANKSDKPEAISLDEIRINFSKVISGRITSIFRTALTSNTNPNELNQSTGLPQAFDWLLLALDIAKNANNAKAPVAGKVVTTTTTAGETKSSMPDPRSPNTLTQKLQSWLTQTETDIPSEEFLAKFRSFTLPSWDHYTHIRIAYVMLTKYGRKDGKEMIFKGIENYIANGLQTTGKSFHFTMTYFWIQIVHFGIRNIPPPSQAPHSDTTRHPNPESDHVQNASSEEFAKFLLVNPHVVDGNLWADYYTKEVLMSPKAKAEMVLPDKQPLPNLVIRDTISSFTSAI